MAFFPCTRFAEKVSMLSRGDSSQQQGWSLERKLEYSMKIIGETNRNYQLICQLCIIAIRKGFKMVIENPASQPHFLSIYFPIKAGWIDKDRRDRGDVMKKPTQFFFVNFEPKHNFIWEPQEYIQETFTVERTKGKERIALRSMITRTYANRFIREFIL